MKQKALADKLCGFSLVMLNFILIKLTIWWAISLAVQQRFFLWTLFNFRLFMIISYSASKPSCKPSPVMAQAAWIYHPLNELELDELDDIVADADDAWNGKRMKNKIRNKKLLVWRNVFRVSIKIKLALKFTFVIGWIHDLC